MSDKFAVVFPGQGSQKVGMLAEVAASSDVISATFAEASEVLGYDLGQMIADGPAEVLNQTEHTQPALLASSVALWRLWAEREGVPAMMAGHSLGEYSALVCAGVITFADGLKLVRNRGRYMQEAVPAGTGGMAAVLGLADEEVVRVCSEVASQAGEVLEAVNFNAPGQVVVAGSKVAVEQSVAAFSEAGARKVMPLPVSVPSHCALMKPAAERLSEDLAAVTFSAPIIPVVQNVTAQVVDDVKQIRENLVRQLYSPVRWVETIRLMADSGVTRLYECGSGNVLSGLGKRIERSQAYTSLESAAAYAELSS
ncbi:MAG: [acyl-carrier-protein] S-malonyltransferase [Oceanospirillales bacterium LUC14_002_19_P2]|nr:MAG: [acyl-carrier-protein] S-malonyltransferase [Oceanospirillales bacterium LUC14_002_19_P2]